MATPIIIIFQRKSLIFVSAYPRQIKIGEVKENDYKNGPFLEFDLSIFSSVYLSFLKILKFFRGTTIFEKDKVEKIADFENSVYQWAMIDDQNVRIFKTEQATETFSLKFNYIQFNELIFSMYQVTIFTLCLKNSQSEFCHFVIQSDPKDMIELTNFKKFKSFISNTDFKDDSFGYFQIFTTYLEILFILIKLKTFCNKSLLPNTLLPLLDI